MKSFLSTMGRFIVSCLFVVGMLLVSYQAQASTASLSGGILTYTAGSGEVNNLTISQSGGIFTITDTGATITASPAEGFTTVSSTKVTISDAGISSIDVTLGDLNDRANLTTVSIPTNISGGW